MNAAAVGWSIKLSDCGIKSNDLYVLQMEAVRLSLTGGQGTIETAQRMRQFISDHERILNAIQCIDRDYAKWDRSDYWRELRVRLGRRSGKKARNPSGIVQKPSPSRALSPPSLISGVNAVSDTILLPCGVLVAGADLVSKKLLDILNESLMEIKARTGVKPLSLILFRHDNRLDGYAKVDDDFGAVAISLPKVWESAVQVVSDGKIGISLTAVVWLKLLIVPLIAVHMCGAAGSNSEYYGSDFHENEYSHALELSCNLIVNLSRKADLEPPNLECDPFLEKLKRDFPEDAEVPQWLKTAHGYFRTVIDHTGSPGKPDPHGEKSFRDYLIEDSKKWMVFF
jgi:hypothetical protein